MTRSVYTYVTDAATGHTALVISDEEFYEVEYDSPKPGWFGEDLPPLPLPHRIQDVYDGAGMKEWGTPAMLAQLLLMRKIEDEQLRR